MKTFKVSWNEFRTLYRILDIPREVLSTEVSPTPVGASCRHTIALPQLWPLLCIGHCWTRLRTTSRLGQTILGISRAAQGTDRAQRNKDIVEERMTRKQIAEAQRMSREWIEAHPPGGN